MALQLLGLDDGPGPSDRDPVLMSGAYLSFLYLRHLRIRELQVRGWSSTLVFRHLQRLVAYTGGFPAILVATRFCTLFFVLIFP